MVVSREPRGACALAISARKPPWVARWRSFRMAILFTLMLLRAAWIWRYLTRSWQRGEPGGTRQPRHLWVVHWRNTLQWSDQLTWVPSPIVARSTGPTSSILKTWRVSWSAGVAA